MAEQGGAGLESHTFTRGLADYLVLRLVGMNMLAELSPGANITDLACLQCIYGPIAEIAPSCNAGNVGGGAATCFVAILEAATAASPLCCSGLQDAEDPAFLSPGLLL